MNFFVLANMASRLIDSPEQFAAMCEEAGLFRLTESSRHDHRYWAGFARRFLPGTSPRRLLAAHDAFLDICAELREEQEAGYLRRYRDERRLSPDAALTREQEAEAREAGAEADPGGGNAPYFLVCRLFGEKDVLLGCVSGGEVCAYRLSELMLSQALVTATALRHEFGRRGGPGLPGDDGRRSDFFERKMLMWRASLFGSEALHFAGRLERQDGTGARPERIFAGVRRTGGLSGTNPIIPGWPAPTASRFGLN